MIAIKSSGAGVVESSSHPPFPKKSSLAVSAIVENREVGWLVAGKDGGKRQTAGPQSPEAPETKATDRLTPFTNVKGDALASKASTNALRNNKRNRIQVSRKRKKNQDPQTQARDQRVNVSS